mmetsp:Transcript_14892/g.21318  ORF Transcript_14892/g.21318 Transcript_14892/m.21318 type:complete len:638 (-) Transcript_14892:72-1985(-)
MTQNSFSQSPPAPPTTQEVNDEIERVSSKQQEWKTLPLKNKIIILEEILSLANTYMYEFVEASFHDRNISDTDPKHGTARGDVYVVGPLTLGNYMNGLLNSLKRMEKSKGDTVSTMGGRGFPPISTRHVEDKTVVQVYPQSVLEYMEAAGLTGELVLGSRGGKDLDSTPLTSSSTNGSLQDTLDETHKGGVVGILGAGNFDAPVEIFNEMFLKGKVVIYKRNPVNLTSLHFLRKIFSPLIERGYLSLLSDHPPGSSPKGAFVGKILVEHPKIQDIVLTGSELTYNKIKWGATPQEQEQNRKNNTPLTYKPICAELGSVNPWVIVPGKGWTESTVDTYASHLVFSKLLNNGHVCASPQIYVVPSDWKYRQLFWERTQYWLKQSTGSAPFYPGLDQIHQKFAKIKDSEIVMQTYGGTIHVKDDCAFGTDQQNCVVIPNYQMNEDNTKADPNMILQTEAFCPVLAEVPLDTPNPSNDDKSEDVSDFLQSATNFIEQNVYGSLTATLIIDNHSYKQHKDVIEKTIATMPFGIIGVNIWPAFGHSMPMLVWGASPYPNRSSSGNGLLGNCDLYRNVEKAVLRAPFRWVGRPAATVLQSQHQELVWNKYAAYKMKPGYLRQFAVLFAVFFNIGKKKVFGSGGK